MMHGQKNIKFWATSFDSLDSSSGPTKNRWLERVETCSPELVII